MLKNPHFKWRHSLQMIAASAMILALMTSCSSSGASKSSADYAADYSDGYSFSNRDYSEEATKELSEDTAVSEGKKTEEITDSQYEDKIIRTANISMESTDAQKCYDTLVAFAKQNGGREISVSKSNDSYGNYDYIIRPRTVSASKTFSSQPMRILAAYLLMSMNPLFCGILYRLY